MMPGDVNDRMAHWQDAQELIEGYPVRRVWEIFNKMLVDRQKFILGSSFGWGGWGFLLRRGTGGRVLRYPDFVETLTYTLDYKCALYPIYPAESGLPLLDSFSNISQYGSRKYPEIHRAYDSWPYGDFLHVTDYKPEEFYKTAAAGGDDEYAFINQYQLFEKLWNLLHYFGGVCINRRGDNIPIFETGGDGGYPGHSFTGGVYSTSPQSDGCCGGLRFFHTPSDNLQYKYLCIGNVATNEEGTAGNGIIQYSLGRNILYESDWIRGTFTSPWIRESSSFENAIYIDINLYIYPHFPDFYDPDTLEPMYF